MRNNNLFGLPSMSLNALSLGVVFMMGCLGVRIVKASDLALSVANTQLVTGNSANKLEQLTRRLNEQAEILKQKDVAYEQVKATYERSLKQAEGYERLKTHIEALEEIPNIDDIDNIEVEISETKEDLLLITE
jgi:pantothenate synthetase